MTSSNASMTIINKRHAFISMQYNLLQNSSHVRFFKNSYQHDICDLQPFPLPPQHVSFFRLGLPLILRRFMIPTMASRIVSISMFTFCSSTISSLILRNFDPNDRMWQDIMASTRAEFTIFLQLCVIQHLVLWSVNTWFVKRLIIYCLTWLTWCVNIMWRRVTYVKSRATWRARSVSRYWWYWGFALVGYRCKVIV